MRAVRTRPRCLRWRPRRVLVPLVLLGLTGCEAYSAYDCATFYDEHRHAVSGQMSATIAGRPLTAWLPSVSPVADRELSVSACLVESGKETWRFSGHFNLGGPVTGEPVTVSVPSSNAPGFFGGFLDVRDNREHHVLLQGAGSVTVKRFDPAARAFDASGIVYPQQGGEIPLKFSFTWAAEELGPRPK